MSDFEFDIDRDGVESLPVPVDFDAKVGQQQAETDTLTGAANLSPVTGILQELALTATADSATTPYPFSVSHVFDLGKEINSVIVTSTVTATDGDGETWGVAPGEIRLSDPVIDGLLGGSVDNVTFGFLTVVTATIDSFLAHPTRATTVGDFATVILLCPRYLRYGLTIWDDTLSDYSGPNNPSATTEVTVRYI
jgi:hypothetical protein